MNFPVISIEGLFVLKMIAFYENWPERYKDLDDVWELLSNYWHIIEDEIFEIHHDQLTDEDFDEMAIATSVLWRKIASAIRKSDAVKQKVLEILTNEVSQDPGSMTKILAQKLESKEIEEARSYLYQILTGIRETTG